MNTNLDFKLASYMIIRLYKAYEVQNVRKTKKTFDSLGCSDSFFQNLDHSSIIWQYDIRKIWIRMAN